MKNEHMESRTQSIRKWGRLYLVDLMILLMSWGGFYRSTLANADTLFGELCPPATLEARLENFRWMGYVGDGISYALGFYPFEHQKVSIGLFLIVLAVGLLLTQMTFTQVMKQRLVSKWDWVVYVAVTSLCYVNVLIAEMFYFTESLLIFKMSILFATLGCLLFSRKHYVTGTLALIIAPMFYQVSCLQAALLLCTLAILEEDGEFSARLVRKELLYIGAPAFGGLLNYLTGSYVLSVVCRIINSEYSAAKSLGGTGLINDRTIHELQDLYTSSLGLMIPVYLPLLFSLVVTAVVICSIRRRPRVLLSYVIYKVVMFAMTVGIQINGSEFTPRIIWIFFVMQAMNAMLALYYVDCSRLRLSIQYISIGYLLAQVFFIQIIIANRCVSETLDRLYSNLLIDRIEAYEEESGEEVTTLAFCTDERARNVYDQVYFSKDAINKRVLGENSYSLVETIARERGRSFHGTEMDPTIYEEYFAGYDWKSLDLDEQVVIQGDTAYICVF